MLKKLQDRLHLFGWIVIIYLISILSVSSSSLEGWKSFFFGLLLLSVGGTTIFFFLKQWESNLRGKIKAPITDQEPIEKKEQEATFSTDEMINGLKDELDQTKEKHEQTSQELSETLNLLQKLQSQAQQHDLKNQDSAEELSQAKASFDEEVRRKNVLLEEYQETINQQRDVIKKKQDKIQDLETKVTDLNYEVKTLLQLSEITPDKKREKETITFTEIKQDTAEENNQLAHESATAKNYQVKTTEDGSKQLKRCLDIARKMTGTNHFLNGNSRFREMSIDSHALDLRRLCDTLQSETSCGILLFSQKENRLLFANKQTQQLLGWTPDKFIQHFPEIIQEGSNDWKKGVTELSTVNESQVRLMLKAKSGHNVLCQCHLSQIQTGTFRNHVIAVLYAN